VIELRLGCIQRPPAEPGLLGAVVALKIVARKYRRNSGATDPDKQGDDEFPGLVVKPNSRVAPVQNTFKLADYLRSTVLDRKDLFRLLMGNMEILLVFLDFEGLYGDRDRSGTEKRKRASGE